MQIHKRLCASVKKISIFFGHPPSGRISVIFHLFELHLKVWVVCYNSNAILVMFNVSKPLVSVQMRAVIPCFNMGL